MNLKNKIKQDLEERYIIKDSSIEFDQLINEFDKWVHISFSKSKNRKQILIY